ncbi:biotin transporter BioY [Paenarthrobacter sp. PH39-S1]|uniref:biotin transporter BioY n=1 Tax=Paenarthrobacter sp. PH39-S1 TaxID=3046204 RepID=UPI0024BB9271|nr:biotin transporter BioY [Paenarthrobacter sp. PH39-S1]MDJ0356714.1 biotin transporter BioY [Paenarthrobacter sp. PH39-S1]
MTDPAPHQKSAEAWAPHPETAGAPQTLAAAANTARAPLNPALLRPASQNPAPLQPAPQNTAPLNSRTPSVSARPRAGWNAADLALIAVFSALMAASISIPGIPVGPLGVPITLQTLAVALCGLVLGLGRGTAAVALYVLLGLIGLPIFSGFRAGPAILAGPSAGYIVGFILGAAVIGVLSPWALRRRAKPAWLFGAACLGMLVIHASGVVGFVTKGMGLWPAIVADAAYFPGDIIKNVLAVAIALTLHRAFPDILLRRRR